MPKIAPAFRGIERPNERSDTSVQSFDCALGSLAQASLDGMERQLDGVKIRRILRQESEACANTPESLLDPSNLVEGHIVSHHNVSTLERRRQTLLDVSQEGFAVHGPLNEHRSHDAVWRRPAMNVTVSQCPIGASATRRSPQRLQPFRRTILVVIAVSSIKTRRAVSSQPCSRIQRRRARATSARLRSSARRLFLNVTPWRAKKRDSALRLAEIRRLRSIETSSFNVRSRCSPIRSRICCEYFSNGDAPPPRGIGSNVPSS